VAAVHGVTVAADLPGIVSKISFESGKFVRAGEVLVQLDSKQEEAQLAAAKAQWELGRLNLDRMRELSAQGIAPKADFDRLDAEFKQAEARAGEIHATIARKTIRAPFSGMLGIRQVDLGQYLEGGSPIVPLQSLDPIYVNFSVPQQQMARLRPGNEVKVRAQDGPELTGKLTATDSIIDEATRNVRVQATFANPDGKLRPGMFVETTIALGTAGAVVALPASAINHAPYGDSVFIVENMKSPQGGQPYRGVRQQFVKVGEGRGDQVAIVSGVKAGDEVVTSGVFKLRNGAAVQVDNKIQPGNNPAPKPEDS
jgi:membrane fusion protein, multidrug efflux system